MIAIDVSHAIERAWALHSDPRMVVVVAGSESRYVVTGVMVDDATVVLQVHEQLSEEPILRERILDLESEIEALQRKISMMEK